MEMDHAAQAARDAAPRFVSSVLEVRQARRQRRLHTAAADAHEDVDAAMQNQHPAPDNTHQTNNPQQQTYRTFRQSFDDGVAPKAKFSITSAAATSSFSDFGWGSSYTYGENVDPEYKGFFSYSEASGASSTQAASTASNIKTTSTASCYYKVVKSN